MDYFELDGTGIINPEDIVSLHTSKERDMKQAVSRMRIVKPHGLPNLRLLRQRKGLSLSQLADMTGLRRDTIAHLEDGTESPQSYHVRLLARALEVRQIELIS